MEGTCRYLEKLYLKSEGGHGTPPLTLVFCSGFGASLLRLQLDQCVSASRGCDMALLLLVGRRIRQEHVPDF